MNVLANLLRWQWQSYWRRILRGGTAAKANLLILGLIAIAGFARYVVFLRDTAKQVAKGDTTLLELLLAAIFLLLLQPGWDTPRLALGSRDMARFPLTGRTRFGLRALSRFVAPFSWALLLFAAAGVWPLFSLPHPIPAALAYTLFAVAAFLGGMALADLSQSSKGVMPVRVCWGALIVFVITWVATRHSFPPLPTHLVVIAGQRPSVAWALAVLATVILAAMGVLVSTRTFAWMLSESPPADRTRPAQSARRISLFTRELRLQSRLVEIRTVWVICVALAFYLATAGQPEPDALRVMLGVLAFLAIGVAMNSFGLDGPQGLDRFLLTPIAFQAIIAAKNRAAALLIFGPCLLLALPAAVRFGWREGVSDGLEALALALATLAWGNVASVIHPESADSGSGGNFVDQYIALAAVGVTTAVAIAALRGSPQLAPVYVLGVASLFGAAYYATLLWSSRYVTRHYEVVRQRLN